MIGGKPGNRGKRKWRSVTRRRPDRINLNPAVTPSMQRTEKSHEKRLVRFFNQHSILIAGLAMLARHDGYERRGSGRHRHTASVETMS